MQLRRSIARGSVVVRVPVSGVSRETSTAERIDTVQSQPVTVREQPLQVLIVPLHGKLRLLVPGTW